MCRPELVEDGEPILELEEMRHPCVSSTYVRVCVLVAAWGSGADVMQRCTG